MFTIGKEFHLLHVVQDLDAADSWYDDVFAVRRFVCNSMKAAMRGSVAKFTSYTIY